MSIEVKENHTGKYKGIAWEIKLLSWSDKDIEVIETQNLPFNKTWYTAYISPSAKYDYSNYDYWSNYIDVHKGFTYGDETQLGWDYNHLHDKTELITKEYILKDIEKAINQYHRKKLIIYLAHKLKYYAFKEKLNKTKKWLKNNILNISVGKKTEVGTINLSILLFGIIRINLFETIYLKDARLVNVIQIGILK